MNPAKDVRSLQVLVKELGRRPKACSLDVPYGAAHADLKSAVSNLVLGPEDERWTKVQEHTKENLDPQSGGGTVELTTKYEAHELQLWTHPHDDCCPLHHVELKDLPPELDVYALLAGSTAPTPSPLDSELGLRAWWASLPRGRHALRDCAQKRLAAKACVPSVASIPVLQRRPKQASPPDRRVSGAKLPNTSDEADGEGVAVEAEGLKAAQIQPASQQQPPQLRGQARSVSQSSAGAQMPHVGGEKPVSQDESLQKGRAGEGPNVESEGSKGKLGAGAGEGEEEGRPKTTLVVGDMQQEPEDTELVKVEMEVPWHLRHDLMLESMQGLWEMATRDRHHPVTLSSDSLAVLVQGLESGALEVMNIAAAAVWVISAKADQRSALIQLGAVEALAGAALIGHTEREHLCRSKQDAAVVEAASKNEAAIAAEVAAQKAAADAEKAIKWAARGIGGAPAETAKHEAIAKAEAAKAHAAVLREEADSAGEAAAALAMSAEAASRGEIGLVGEGDGEVTQEKRPMLLLCNRLVYHCLGALGVMAVDPKARAVALQVSPTLSFFTHLALADFPISPPLRLPSPSPQSSSLEHEQQPDGGAQTEQGESEAGKEDTSHKPSQASGKDPASESKGAEGAVEAKGLEAAKSEGAQQDGEHDKTAAAAAAASKEEGSKEGQDNMRESSDTPPGEVGGDGVDQDEEVMPEDDPLVHQKMAVEVLYAMLGRDRDVRASLAQNNGLKDLLELTKANSGDVRSVSLLCFNAYARDVAPPTHARGHDMLASSEQALPVVHGLLSALEDLLEMHRCCPPELHLLGLEQHPLLVVVETAASALWGAMAAQVSFERLKQSPPEPDSDHGSTDSTDPKTEARHQLSYVDMSMLARAAGRLVALLQDMEAYQLETDFAGTSLYGAQQQGQNGDDGVLSNAPFPAPYEDRSTASCTAVSLYCIMASLALVHGHPMLTARAHALVTKLHVDLQQLQLDTGTAKETLDAHVSSMISKRTASKFFIDDDDEALKAKELEEALLAVHEHVHSMQKKIEDVEETLQSGCEECLAAAQDVLRLRLHLVAPQKPHESDPAGTAEGSMDGASIKEDSGSDWGSGLGRTGSGSSSSYDLMGLVHLAAASMVTAMAQTAHPALVATPVDPSPVFQGPFRALLRSAGVLKDLTALVTDCYTCSGDPQQLPRTSPSSKAVVADAHEHGAGGVVAAPEEAPDTQQLSLSRVHSSRAPTRPDSATTQHSEAAHTHSSRPPSAMTHKSEAAHTHSSRPPSAMTHKSEASHTQRPASARSTNAAIKGHQPPQQTEGRNEATTTEGGAQEQAADKAPKLETPKAQSIFGEPPRVHAPPPTSPVAVATRLVVAAGVSHLLASDEPVGQYQLQQLLAYMQHQSATTTTAAKLLSDLIAQTEQEMNDEERLIAGQGAGDADSETDLSLVKGNLPSQAVLWLRELHAAHAGCESLTPFLAACMWCLCRHETSRKGLLAGDSEAWIALLESWLVPGLAAVNHHHCIIHPGPDGFYTRPHHPNRSPPAQQTGPAATKAAVKKKASEEEHSAEEGQRSPAWFSASLGRSGQWGASTSGSTPGNRDFIAGMQQSNAGSHQSGFAPFGLASLAAAAQPSRSAASASCQVRNSLMSIWLLLRQWLTDNLSPMNLLRSCQGLFVVGGASWWQLPLSINTPLSLSNGVSRALYNLMEASTSLPDVRGTDGGALRKLTMLCCWNLSVVHPAIEERLVNLGNALLGLATAASPTACSSLLVVAINYVLSLTPTPAHVEAMGGLIQVAGMLSAMVDKALSTADSAGRGADLAVLEAATRGMARLGLSSQGRRALKRCGCIKRLVNIAHADNVALEEVATRRVTAGVPDWEDTEELVAPLRAVNHAMPTVPTAAQKHIETTMQAAGLQNVHSSSAVSSVSANWGAESGGVGWEGTQLLPTEYPDLPLETRKSAAEVAAAAKIAAQLGAEEHGEGSSNAGSSAHDHSIHTGTCDSGHGAGGEEEVGGDADVGLMSLWGLLNLSNYEPAQVSICRHGLYTLLRMVHRSIDPRRRSTAAAILSNIHFHPDNATTLYKAEIKLKFAALLKLRGLHQEAQKAKLHQLPHGIQPDSLKAKALAKSVAQKARPLKGTLGGEGGPSRSPVRTGSARDAQRRGNARALAASQIDKGVKLMQASSDKDQSPKQKDQGPPKNPYLAGGQGLEETEDGQAVEDPDALEAKLAFLRWVVEPGVHVLGEQPAAEALNAGDLSGGAAMTQADLLSRLTSDPEEEAWIAYISSVAAMDDFEHTRMVQGDYLRGSFSRSLAEGARSLWQNRVIRAPAPVPTRHSSTPSPRASLSMSRPATARPQSQHTLSRPATSRAGTTVPSNGGAATAFAKPTHSPSNTHTGRGENVASRVGKDGGVEGGHQALPSKPGAGGMHDASPSPTLRPRPSTAYPRSSSKKREASAAVGESAGKANASSGGAVSGGNTKLNGDINGANGIGHGTQQNGSSSGNGSKSSAKRGSSRLKGSAPARPSTAPAGKSIKGIASLRNEAENTTMWSPHVKSFVQSSKHGTPALLAQRLLRASIPTASTDQLASLADDILENKVVKEGRRAAEEAAAAEAAARRAADEEAEAERQREASIAEELRVIDVTRFELIRSIDRRRSSMGRSRMSSYGGATMSESGDEQGPSPRRRASRSMSRALSVAVSRASTRGEARAAERAAEHAAHTADAVEAAKLPTRRPISRTASKRSHLNNSSSTHQTSFGSIKSVTSEGGWPKGDGGYSPSSTTNDETEANARVTAVQNSFGKRTTQADEHAQPNVLKEESAKNPEMSETVDGGREQLPVRDVTTRYRRPTAVRFGQDESSSEDSGDAPGLPSTMKHVPSAQFGAVTADDKEVNEVGKGLSCTERAAERALAEVEAQASPRMSIPSSHPMRGSASFVATSLVQIGTLSSMNPTASPRSMGYGGRSRSAAAMNTSHESSLPTRHQPSPRMHNQRHLPAQHQSPPRFQQQQQQQGGIVEEGSGMLSDAYEDGEGEPDVLGPHVRAALQGPVGPPYHLPYRGSTRPPGQTLTSLKRDLGHEAWEAVVFPERAAARAERLAKQSTLADHVPRPTTTLSVDATEFTALRRAEQALQAMMASDGGSGPKYDYVSVETEARRLREKVQAELPVAVRLATGDGGPEIVYQFSHRLAYNPRHLVMFEHIEGATFCESLYGHYLLPNGKLAHFALGDTVRKGHKVDLAHPPAIPFSALDWLHAPRGPLPTTKAFADWSLPGTRRTAGMLTLLWCPIPALGPSAPTTMEGGIPLLQWKDLSSPVLGHEAQAAAEATKPPMLVLRSVCIMATLLRITRETVETTTVPPKPKVVHKKKKKPGVPGARPPARTSRR